MWNPRSNSVPSLSLSSNLQISLSNGLIFFAPLSLKVVRLEYFYLVFSICNKVSFGSCFLFGVANCYGSHVTFNRISPIFYAPKRIFDFSKFDPFFF